MTAFTEETVEAILSACSANVAALAESLSRCFDRPCHLEIGESGIWSPAELPDFLYNPGLVALIQVESQALAVLVPETLPLPQWAAHPGDDEQPRLDALLSEWSQNLLPADQSSPRFRAPIVPDLAQAVELMAPAEWAATLELLVFDVDNNSDSPAGKLLIVWPLENPTVDIEDASWMTSAPAAAARTEPSHFTAAPEHKRVDLLARLRHLPVEVSVRLAEKKIPMSQLLSITPGMLITFNKSCEDLLDLYVNNSRYCRGEAVKIGENFGMKINQVGVKEELPHKVIDA